MLFDVLLDQLLDELFISLLVLEKKNIQAKLKNTRETMSKVRCESNSVFVRGSVGCRLVVFGNKRIIDLAHRGRGVGVVVGDALSLGAVFRFLSRFIQI